MLGVDEDDRAVDVMVVGAGGQVGTKFVEAAGLEAAVAPAPHHIAVVVVVVDLVRNDQIHAVLSMAGGLVLDHSQAGCRSEKTNAMLLRHAPGHGLAPTRHLRAVAVGVLAPTKTSRAGSLQETIVAQKRTLR